MTGSGKSAANLAQRHFTANHPKALRLADVTYIPTDEEWLYLAAILDVFSRYVVGRTVPREGDPPLGSRQRIHGVRSLDTDARPSVSGRAPVT